VIATAQSLALRGQGQGRTQVVDGKNSRKTAATSKPEEKLSKPVKPSKKAKQAGKDKQKSDAKKHLDNVKSPQYVRYKAADKLLRQRLNAGPGKRSLKDLAPSWVEPTEILDEPDYVRRVEEAAAVIVNDVDRKAFTEFVLARNCWFRAKGAQPKQIHQESKSEDTESSEPAASNETAKEEKAADAYARLDLTSLSSQDAREDRARRAVPLPSAAAAAETALSNR
jgi:hypothetical protein